MRCPPCRARKPPPPKQRQHQPRNFPPGSNKPSIAAMPAADALSAARSDSAMIKTVFRFSSRAAACDLLCMPLLAAAQQAGLPAWTSTPTAGGGQSNSQTLQPLLLQTALSFLPAALLMMTSFTRIIIVLSLLRQALGTQTAPPNQVMVGLALFLTLFVMGPVLDKIYTEAYQPLSENMITMQQALDKGATPLKAFMLKQTRESDLALYVKLSNSAQLRAPGGGPRRGRGP